MGILYYIRMSALALCQEKSPKNLQKRQNFISKSFLCNKSNQIYFLHFLNGHKKLLIIMEK